MVMMTVGQPIQNKSPPIVDPTIIPINAESVSSISTLNIIIINNKYNSLAQAIHNLIYSFFAIEYSNWLCTGTRIK